MNDPLISALQKKIASYEDMKAYAELYDIFFPSLFKFSYAIVKSREAAEEIVSDVFIKIWQLRHQLASINNLKVYLYSMTKNYSLNYIAKNYKVNVISLDNLDMQTFITLNDPESKLISTETENLIRHAINELPSQCKIIFQLVKEEGLKYKEVAAILNISVLTVRNQVAIAIKKVAGALPAVLQDRLFIQKKFSAS